MGCEYSCVSARQRRIVGCTPTATIVGIRKGNVKVVKENLPKLNPNEIFFSTAKLNLNKRQIDLMKRHWSETLMAQREDIFHKAMLLSIESSPKMNEVIACQRYCYRDLTKWPKLNTLCQAQREFFRLIIIDLELSENEVVKEATRLGRTHASMAQYGLKPHFLDIWNQQFLKLLENLKMDDEYEKHEYIEAWSTLNCFVIEWMNYTYSREMEQRRKIIVSN
ncbi:hypothetical protein Tcan_10425 [Toxocara canis]|uniref:Globin family profile domain-containing protein n=1 Tax=Toxocara canis TaxID=6265 RepID=A0A0B2VMJ8_TOXCA|nr:hypothetical protein Tcan_10425 [Toxocara canis]